MKIILSQSKGLALRFVIADYARLHPAYAGYSPTSSLFLFPRDPLRWARAGYGGETLATREVFFFTRMSLEK